MLSPFPGMDPYLEGPKWMNVHAQLTAEIARQLAPRIRPKYLAITTERFVEETPDSVAITATESYPEVSVVESGRGATALQAVVGSAPLQLATIIPAAVPHFAVEIRDRRERRLVTAIEVLSPTNKRGVGRAQYLAKRQRLLHSSAHLLEIDLLRHGRRVPMREPLPAVPYFVLLSRVEHRPITDVWAVSLRGPLPTVQVPLLPGDADAPLDLQAALTTIYDACGYELSCDYTQPPSVPLAPADATWADDMLRAAKLRN